MNFLPPSLCRSITAGILATLPWGLPAFAEPLDRSFVPLFGVVPGGQLAEDITDESIQFIARSYGWINSHGGKWLEGAEPVEYFAGKSGQTDGRSRTVGARLRELNPDIILSNYRNGAYTSQNALSEAMEVESEFVLAVAVHDTTARLAEPVSGEATTLQLTLPPMIPAGRTPWYPFKASTTENDYTIDKDEYVTWLRIGDEVMRIDAITRQNDLLQLQVRRGIWGTQATRHEQGVAVLQPVYCGAVHASGQEYYLSGLLDGNSPQPAVRYIMQQQHPGFWEFLARKVEGILDEGIEPWFDCATSSWINHANAYGDRITAPLDLETGRLLDRDTLREYQQRKFDALYERFPDAKFYVNWIFPQWWEDKGNERLMFTGANGYRPVDGGAIEMHANEQFMPWLVLMRAQIDQRDRNITTVSWAKEADRGADADMSDEYQFFSYCTFLMVYEQDAPQFWGAAWEARPPYGRFTPPDFVYWDLGEPEERFASIDEAEIAESPGVYRRKFSNGHVIVNPGEMPRHVRLETAQFDVRAGLWRNELWLQPRTAKIVLEAAPPQD